MRSTDAILDAAMARFAREGFGASLRAIADDAGVSAALIVHHFGSKQGLREAVDAHVLGISDEKVRLLREEGGGAAAALIMPLLAAGDLPRYLARVLVEGGDAADHLFASFVDATDKALLDLGVELGDPRLAAALLVTQTLGTILMAARVHATVGVELFSADGVGRWVGATTEIYRGALAPLLP